MIHDIIILHGIAYKWNFPIDENLWYIDEVESMKEIHHMDKNDKLN
jgi:hypothetical protein